MIASLTTVLFGLWPAWQASHADVQLALKEGSSGSGDPPSAKRARDWLVISEIALTLTLLVAAGLVLKSFSRLQSLSLGYEPRALFTARFELPWRKYNDRDKIDTFAKALLDKVRAIPGVQNAAISSNGPLMGGWQTGFWREENPRPQPSDMLNSDLEVVGGDYFPTLKVPLVRGRTFNERDTKDSPRVIIIDQAMAEQYFPGEDPIGKRLGVDAGNDDEGWVMSEIVGVVAKMRFHAVDEMAPLPVIYCSLGQAQRTSLTLFVRSTMGSASLERSIRDAVTSIDPSLPVFDARPMSDRVRETWGSQRLLSFLFSVFAGLALMLATIGLYGLLAYTTLKRVREIGIRLALGARPAQIRALILSHGMQLLLIGSVIGLVAAVALSRALQSVLFEVRGIDPRIYLGVGALLFAATFFASWIPARRASRVDPMSLCAPSDMNDLKFAFRQLRKSPGFTLVAVLTLALGIGANTAIFSVVQNILFQPLPYANSARLYAIWASSESTGQRQIAASGPDYLDYRDQNRSFAQIAEYLPRFTFTWTGEGEPKLVTCTGVSEDFFATLGVHAYLGRLYEPREYTYLENDSMVVSYRFWKNQLGGDPHVIGRTIRLQDDSVTIIGVLPPMSDLFPDTDVWPKLTTNPSWPFMQWRSNKFLRVIGELRPGVTPAMAEEDLTAILRRAPEQAGDVRVQLVPLKDDLVGNVRVRVVRHTSRSGADPDRRMHQRSGVIPCACRETPGRNGSALEPRREFRANRPTARD